MKAATAIGIAIAAVGLLGGAVMEGTSPVAFINIPAILIVLGGTFGACMASCGMEGMKRLPALYKKSMNAEPIDLTDTLANIVRYADRARRDGLLALEEELEQIDDEYLKKGLQLVVDGTDPDLVRDILEAEIEGMTARHRKGAEPFDKAGGFAPTMGIIGTVMGLIHVLENLAHPETLGPSISSAFIATLFGVASANVIYYPIAYRLKGLSSVEADGRAMVLEGIMAIQAGDNPRIVTEKLLSFIAPEGREAAREAVTGPKLQAVPGGEEQQAEAA
jgi:chemotaxis protein MotA